MFSVSSARPVARVTLGAVGVGTKMDTLPTLPADIQIPELPDDALLEGDTDAIVDWICDMASQMTGQEVQVDRQRLQEFVEQSTLTDYVAEKAAGYAADFINGTKDTQLTAGELMNLLEENETLIEETFQVHFTREMKQNLEQAITTTIEDNRLNEVIHEQVFASMEQQEKKASAHTHQEDLADIFAENAAQAQDEEADMASTRKINLLDDLQFGKNYIKD